MRRRTHCRWLDTLPAGTKNVTNANKQFSDTLVVTLEIPWLTSASQVVSGTKQPSALTDVLIAENRRRTEKTW